MALTFNLEGIDAASTLDVDPSYPAVTDDVFSTDVSANSIMTATDAQSVSLTGVFKFKTDSTDLSGGTVAADDVSYQYAGTWPLLDFASAIVTNNPINPGADDDGLGNSNSIIEYDVVRSMAKDLTGGYFASDIFSNEKALREEVRSLNTDLQSAVQAILGTQATVDIIGRHLLEKCLNDATRREELFAKIATENSDNTASPLKENDVLEFSVSYAPKTATGHGLGNNTITTRKYKVSLTLGNTGN
jgi:hypothetical protein